MGSNKLEQPRRIGEKLKKIRQKILGVTQLEMKAIMETKTRAQISAYETGKKFPSYIQLLKLVKYIEKHTSFLIRIKHIIDDTIDLPYPK